jgi:hypothetical protein
VFLQLPLRQRGAYIGNTSIFKRKREKYTRRKKTVKRRAN